MSIVKEGWVEKCGPRIMPTWHRRWLVLYDSRVLEYFIDNSKKKLQGVIELTGGEDLNINGDPGKLFTYGFYLETDSRTYKLAVKNADQRAMWISALRDVISGTISKKIEARRKNNDNGSGGANDTQSKDSLINKDKNKHERTESQGFEKFTAYAGDSTGSLGAHSKSTGALLSNNNNGNNSRGSIERMNDDRKEVGSNNDNSSKNNNGTMNNPSDVMNDDNRNDRNDSNIDGLSRLAPKLSNIGDSETDGDENGSEISNFNLLIANNPKVLSCIVAFLQDVKKNEFSKLFQINKSFRNHLSLNSEFYDNYTVFIYPKHVLKRFSSQRSQARPWIMAHDYKQVWVFGNVERMTYAHLDLKPFNLANLRRIYIDDPKLWDVFVDEIEDILAYLQLYENKVEELTVRCWKSDPGWIQQLPKLRKIISLTMEFSFQRTMLSNKNIINPSNILFLSLRRVDLLTDEKNDDIALRAAFHSLDRLIVCNLEESRWDHAIVLPPRLKVLRYIPSDKSDIDVSRLLHDNDSDSEEDTNNKSKNKKNNNYPCELIIKQELWPNVLNHNIISGHEAYQARKLRVWVLKKSRRWDGKLLYVNYCNQPPPMKAFAKESCYDDVLKLDNLQNMGEFWASRQSRYWRKRGM